MEFRKLLIFTFLISSVVLIGKIVNGSEKLVIDTDAGADDAVAILLVLSAWAKNDSNIDIAAITCVYGNTEEKNVEKNVLKILSTVNATNIPIYGGAQKPIMEHYIPGDYFGKDGLGDFEFNDGITSEVNNSIHAAVALVNLAKQYSGKLNILALGPLTNIAIAMMLDPNFANNVNRFYIMGGSVAGIGNKAPGVEFNFGIDPDSVWIVLNSITNKTKIIYPWETTINAVISVDWRIDTLGSKNSKIMKFLNKVEQKYVKKTEMFWRPADAMTAAVMIWPDLADKTFVTNVSPVIDGAARGSLLVDYPNKSGKAANVEIIQDFNVEKFQDILILYFS